MSSVAVPLQITVTDPPPPPLLISAPNPMPNGIVGSFYVQPLGANGGVKPYQWSVTSGSLPPGVNLDPNTGEISGTPTVAGAYNFTVQVQDAAP